ncbi:MAG: hypothetical protein R2991_03265 [Thermoanaerobaculia bacterium]
MTRTQIYLDDVELELLEKAGAATGVAVGAGAPGDPSGLRDAHSS